MAEIKRTRAGQSFLNKPIGVARVTTGAEKVYEQQADFYSGVGEFAFELAKEDQITRGKEYANTARVRDEDGNLQYKKLPFSLGRYGQAAANDILSKRYLISLKDDMAVAASEISKVSNDDPAVWEENFSAWVKERSDLLEASGATEVIPSFVDGAYNYQKEFVNGLVVKSIENEEKRTNATYFSTTRQSANDIESAIASGSFDDASKLFDAAILENNNLYATNVISLDVRNKTESMYLKSRLDGLVKGRFSDASPPVLKALAVELRGGTSPLNVLGKNRDIKEAFESLSDSDQTTFANAISKNASAQTELFKLNQEQVDSHRRVGMGIAKGEDISAFFKAATFENSTGELEAVGNGINILRSPESMEAAAGYMRSAGHLDPEFAGVVKNLLNGVDYTETYGPEFNQSIIGTALSAIESDQMFNGKSVLRSDMGLDEADLLRLNYLREAQRDGPTAFSNALNILSTKEARYEIVKEGLGEDFKAKTLLGLADEVAEKMGISKELKPELRNTIVDSLVLHKSFSKASEKVNEVMEQLYVEDSKYVEGMTKFAPEVRIPELATPKDNRFNFLTYAMESFKGDRNYGRAAFALEDDDFVRSPLDTIIDKKLSLALSKNLTKDNVTLVPNQNLSDDKRTVYFIKDKKTGLNVTDSRGKNVVIDTKEFDNLIKAERLKDQEYEQRYTAFSDEIDAFLSSMFGPHTKLTSEFVTDTFSRLHSQGREFEVPEYGLTKSYSSIVEKLFANLEDTYND